MSASIKKLDPDFAFQPIPDSGENNEVGTEINEGMNVTGDPFLMGLEMAPAPLFLFSPEGDVIFANVAGTEYVAEFKPDDNLEFSLKVRDVIFGMDETSLEGGAQFGTNRLVVRRMPFGGENLYSVQIEAMPEEANPDLEFMAYHDELTGIKNFRAYNQVMETISKAIAQSGSSAADDDKVVAMILVDVDDFKKVNDTMGHKFGNRVLQEIGRFFLSAIRDEDDAFRIGGDEFAIISYQESTEKARIWATRIHKDLSSHLGKLTGKDTISISMGFSVLECEQDSEESIFDQADKSLYQAKENGKASIVIQ